MNEQTAGALDLEQRTEARQDTGCEQPLQATRSPRARRGRRGADLGEGSLGCGKAAVQVVDQAQVFRRGHGVGLGFQ